MTQPVTVFSTTTCSSCKVAAKRLTAAGIPFEKVDLDLPEHAEQLAELKRHLETDIVNVPIIRWGTRHEGMVGLASIIHDYKEAAA